jgi:hypothetical protein
VISASDVLATFVVTRTWAAVIAALALLLLLAIVQVVIAGQQSPINAGDPVAERRHGVKALVIGADGRASTSKVQAVLATFAVLFAFVFLLVWGRSVDCSSKDAGCKAAATARAAFDKVANTPLQAEYYVILGFPVAAAVAAKALTANKVASGTLTKPPIAGPAPPKGIAAGVAEVVSNDNGETDLLDFQYFAFTLLTLAYFLLQFLTHPANGLPDLPPTLIGLSGFSVAAYTTKQALRTDVKPAISTVIPPTIPATVGTKVRIIGTGFGEPPAAPAPGAPAPSDERHVLLGGVDLTFGPTDWHDNAILATMSSTTGLPTGPDPAASTLSVLDADGTASEPFAVTIT